MRDGLTLKWGWRLVAWLALVFAAFTVWYHSLEWWWAPGRLHALGRVYLREPGSVSGAQARAESGASLHTVGHLPLGQAILAIRARHTPTVIFIHEFNGRYIAYSLSGGP